MIEPTAKPTAPLWHALGAGSIGCLFAAHMAANGTPCRLLLRDSAWQYWQKNRAIDLHFGDAHYLQGIDAEKPNSTTLITHLLITTKAQDTLAAVQAIAHRLMTNATVCLLQNGMGIAEQLLNRYPAITLIQASTAEAVNRPHHDQPFRLIHAGRATTVAGMIRGEKHHAEQFAAACGPILAVEVVDDIATPLWRKLAVNAVINPLTAINDCDNGALAQLPLRNAVQQLCDELELLAPVLAEKTGNPAIFQHIRKQVFTVIEQTAKNCSSMRADLRAKRKTEIDYISGFLCAQAQQYGITLPRHAALLQLIRLKEAGYDQ